MFGDVGNLMDILVKQSLFNLSQKLQAFLIKPDNSGNPFCCPFLSAQDNSNKKIVANGGAALPEKYKTTRFQILYHIQ